MNNQPETYPPAGGTPAGQPRIGRNTVLIVIIALVVLCCLCTLVASAGAAAYFILRPASVEQVPDFLPGLEETPFDIPEFEEPFPFESTPLEDVFPFEETPGVEPFLLEETPDSSNPNSLAGLGVSREEMLEYYSAGGAFEFGEPQAVEGLDMVMGVHTSMCLDGNCAAVTLAGPAEDLLVISIVVPTRPGDSGQSLLALTLLMDTIARYADDATGANLPAEIMTDVLAAQSAGETIEKTYENNG
jgi:hypothetical protein